MNEVKEKKTSTNNSRRNTVAVSSSHNIKNNNNNSSEIPELYVKLLEVREITLKIEYNEYFAVLKVPPYELHSSTQPLRASSMGVKWSSGEQFVFQVKNKDRNLTIVVWGEATLSDKRELLGEVVIPLNNLENQKLISQYYPLHKSKKASETEILLEIFFAQPISNLGAKNKLETQYANFTSLLFTNNYSLVLALCDATDMADADKVATSLVRVFCFYNQIQDLLKLSIFKEVKLTASTSVLFRSNSMAVKLISFYSRKIGSLYLGKILGSLIEEISQSNVSYETDPSRVSEGVDAKQNCEKLVSLSGRFLNQIIESLRKCPLGIRTICFHFQLAVSERFSEFWRTAVGGFFFLRFICPAIVVPKSFEIINFTPSKEGQRCLVLISKVLQNLANGTHFKEQYMQPLNVFIDENKTKVETFFESLANLPDNVPPTGEDELYQEYIPDPVEVLNDLHLLHQYFVTYTDKIAQATEDADLSEPIPFNQLIPILRNVSVEKQGMMKPYNVDYKLLTLQGAIKIEDLSSSDVLSPDEESILNIATNWTDPPRDLCVVAADLLGRIYKLYLSQMKIKEPTVNWGAISRISKEFKKFVQATGELQQVFLVDINYPGRLAFWINIYNCMVLHLHVVVGPPDNLYRRRTFFSHYKYKIGGYVFSLNDIYHGILRGNPKNPITRHRQFRSSDLRRQFVLPGDPRVHFALSCLNQSTPFIRVYVAKIIEEELQRAGELFLKQHVVINLARKEILLPKIFDRYQNDFPKRKNDELFKWIFQFLHPKKRLDMLLLLQWGNFTVLFKRQSWIPHSKEETKKAAELDMGLSSGQEYPEEQTTAISKRKTAIVGEQDKRSLEQMALMTDELIEETKEEIPKVSDKPPVTVASNNNLEKPNIKQENQEQILQSLLRAISFSTLEIFMQFDFIKSEISKMTNILSLIAVAKSIKSVNIELQGYYGSFSAETINQTNVALSDKLSDLQIKLIPQQKHQQFLNFTQEIQTMVHQAKHYIKEMSLRTKNSETVAEILAIARLISKIRKELSGLVDEIRGSVPKRHSLLDRQKALQMTAISEIEEIRILMKAVLEESREHAENLSLMDSIEEQILILLIGRIIRFIKHQLDQINVATKPLEIDRNEFVNWIPTPDDKEKIIRLTQLLVGAILKIDERLLVLMKNISLKSLNFGTLLSLRNIHNALSYLKGKKQKIKFKSSKKLSVKFSNPAPEVLKLENEKLISKLSQETEQRRHLEQELQQTKKELEDLQKTLEESKNRLNIIGKNKSFLRNKIQETSEENNNTNTTNTSEANRKPSRIRSRSFDSSWEGTENS